MKLAPNRRTLSISTAFKTILKMHQTNTRKGFHFNLPSQHIFIVYAASNRFNVRGSQIFLKLLKKKKRAR